MCYYMNMPSTQTPKKENCGKDTDIILGKSILNMSTKMLIQQKHREVHKALSIKQQNVKGSWRFKI